MLYCIAMLVEFEDGAQAGCESKDSSHPTPMGVKGEHPRVEGLLCSTALRVWNVFVDKF